jgi:hypothetical protein
VKTVENVLNLLDFTRNLEYDDVEELGINVGLVNSLAFERRLVSVWSALCRPLGLVVTFRPQTECVIGLLYNLFMIHNLHT